MKSQHLVHVMSFRHTPLPADHPIKDQRETLPNTRTVMPAGRHLVDASMFQLLWGPAVHALCAIIDNVSRTDQAFLRYL